MTTAKYRAHMASPEWAELRERKLDEVGHTCWVQRNHRKKNLNASPCKGYLQVHHKHYRTLGHERLKDLEVFCEHHHEVADELRKRPHYYATWLQAECAIYGDQHRMYEEALTLYKSPDKVTMAIGEAQRRLKGVPFKRLLLEVIDQFWNGFCGGRIF